MCARQVSKMKHQPDFPEEGRSYNRSGRRRVKLTMGGIKGARLLPRRGLDDPDEYANHLASRQPCTLFAHSPRTSKKTHGKFCSSSFGSHFLHISKKLIAPLIPSFRH